MPDEIAIRNPELIEIGLLDSVDWNPNEESDVVFGALVDQIREHGFMDPLKVWAKSGGRYDVLAGEHRLRAAQILSMKNVPCFVLEVSDDDLAKIMNVRDNMVRGRISPVKFTRLFNDLASRYGPDAVRRMMGAVEDRAFKSLYRDVRSRLPPEIRRRLDRTRQEIGDIDDLTRVLKTIMAQHGSQLDHSFIVFSFARRDHLMVKAGARTWSNLMRISDECLERGDDLNERICSLLEAH